MFRTACIFVALALCAATAPPRISLELTGTNISSLPGSDMAHHQGVVTHDYAEECEASKTDIAAADKCVFPIAKAYDSQDGKIDVTSAIKLLDNDGVEMNMPVDLANDNTDGVNLINPFTTAAAFKTRSTYIFDYDAKDAAGNNAAQVTFALVFNDVVAPTVTNEGVTATVEYGDAGILNALKTIGCDDNVDETVKPSVSVTTSASASLLSHGCTTDMTGANILKCAEANTNTVPFDATDPTITVKTTCQDSAGIYGANGSDNVEEKTFVVSLEDTTPPRIACSGSELTSSDACDAETHECQRTNTDAITAQSPATCYDNTLPTEWAHVMQTVTSSNAAAIVKSAVTGVTGIDTTYSCSDTHTNDAETKTQKFIVTDTTPPSVVIDYTESTSDAIADPSTNIAGVSRDGGAAPESRTINNDGTEAPGLVHMITPHGDNVAAMMDACCQGSVSGNLCVPDYSFTTHNSTVTSKTCRDTMDGISTSWTCDDSSSSCQMEENFAGIHITDLFNVSDECSASVSYSAEWNTTFTPKIPGTYVRAYTFTDDVSLSTTGHVNIVLQDPDAPMLQMIKCDQFVPVVGNEPAGCVTHISASSVAAAINYEDEGASCHDFVDGSLSHAVEVSGQVVDLSAIGTYLINYNCQDLSGNEAATQTRTVVVFDNQPCDFTTTNVAEENYVEAGFPFDLDDAAVVCSDSLDGLLTVTHTASCESNCGTTETGEFVTCLGGAADAKCTAETKSNFASVYHVTYSATDAANNSATEFTRTITVKDTLPPVITLSHNSVFKSQGGDGTSAANNEHGDTTHNGLTATNKFTYNPASVASGTSITLPTGNNPLTGSNPYITLMAESSSVNGWLIAAVASAVTGVALLGFSSKRSNQVMVPV